MYLLLSLEYYRGCGPYTSQKCEQLKDRLSCQDAPQCMWLGFRNPEGSLNFYQEVGCQDFDCSYNMGGYECDQYSECQWDQEQNGMYIISCVAFH